MRLSGGGKRSAPPLPSGGQALAGDFFHHIAETVEFAKGSVNIGCDTDAFELLMNDRRREDAMLAEEVTANRSRVDSINFDIGNRT